MKLNLNMALRFFAHKAGSSLQRCAFGFSCKKKNRFLFFDRFRAFSLMELMFALVALSLALAAFAPIISKKITQSAKSAATTTLIKTDECKTLVNEYCNLCNSQTKECLSCDIEPTFCTSGKTLNYKKCSCE